MIVAILLQLLWGVGVKSDKPFNNPPGVDIWCGKAYRATNSSFDPGGQIVPPKAVDGNDRITILTTPRYNLYLSSESTASLIVSTIVSKTGAEPFENWTYYPHTDPDHDPTIKYPLTELDLTIRDYATGTDLVSDFRIPVNATDIEVSFNLSSLVPNSNGQVGLAFIANSPDVIHTYQGFTYITVLPGRNDTGSVARTDALYGGISVKSSLTHDAWRPVFPYSFYTSWDWIASTINNASSPKNLSTFRAEGFNIIHPIPPGGDDPFNHTLFSQFLSICDSLQLYVMYDMRHTYQNNTSISAQLSYLQQHPSLLLYYTADEPDGWSDPLNATSLAYTHIKTIDPYHPVSLVLNCADFYFEAYTAGADIILEDAYPVAVNTSFSTVYHTPCNSSYGDCGCDGCHAGDPAYPAYVHNPFLDIIERTETMYLYQTWLKEHRTLKKPVWGVPQNFWDQGSFWDRWPTAAEAAVQSLLRINHGAKAIVAWSYPTAPEIEAVSAQLASVLTSVEVSSFLLGGPRIPLEVSGGDGLVDVTAWTRRGVDAVLVSIVNQGYAAVSGEVEIKLPGPKKAITLDVLFGEVGWETKNGTALVKSGGVKGLETAVLMMMLEM